MDELEMVDRQMHYSLENPEAHPIAIEAASMFLVAQMDK